MIAKRSRALTHGQRERLDGVNRLAEFQAVFPLVQPEPAVLQHARELHVSRGVSFLDAMILAACAEAGVEILYSEDIPGVALNSPRIVNPFQ